MILFYYLVQTLGFLHSEAKIRNKRKVECFHPEDNSQLFFIANTLECLIAVHVRLFFLQIFGCMYGLIRHCMSIYTRITEFITYKKPKIITVCITILSYLYVKYALLQACMFKNSLKQLCLYVYMDCTAIKHSRVLLGIYTNSTYTPI